MRDSLLAICGLLVATNGVIGFLLRGTPVKQKEAPHWMVSIHKESEDIFNCAGTLLSPHIVHSAAHCLRGISDDNRMVMTLNDYKADVHEDREIVRKTSDFFKASNHHSLTNKKDDYGLLFFKKPVSICDANDPDTLMIPLILDPAIFPNVTVPDSMEKGSCIVTGWGLDEYGRYEHRLHFARTRRVLRAHGGLAVRKYQREASACNGDSGSPLICAVNGMPIMLGNVAGGIALKEMGPDETDWERCEERVDIYAYIYRQLPELRRAMEERNLWDEFVATQRRCREFYAENKHRVTSLLQ